MTSCNKFANTKESGQVIAVTTCTLQPFVVVSLVGSLFSFTQVQQMATRRMIAPVIGALDQPTKGQHKLWALEMDEPAHHHTIMASISQQHQVLVERTWFGYLARPAVEAMTKVSPRSTDFVVFQKVAEGDWTESLIEIDGVYRALATTPPIPGTQADALSVGAFVRSVQCVTRISLSLLANARTYCSRLSKA